MPGRQPSCSGVSSPPGLPLCVAELTSNHLAVCSAGPQIACITNVWPDHVDQHGSLEAYLAAKARIVAFQSPGDWTVVNADDPGAVALAAGSAGASFAARSASPASDPGAGVEAGRLTVRLAGEELDLGQATRCRRRPGRETGLLAARARCSPAPRPTASPRRSRLAGTGAAARAARRRRTARPSSATRSPPRRRRPRRARTARARFGRPDRGRLRRPRRRADALVRGGARAVRARGGRGRAGLRARRRLRPGGPAARRGAHGRRPADAKVHATLAGACAGARAHAAPGRTIVFAPWFPTTPDERASVPGLLGL